MPPKKDKSENSGIGPGNKITHREKVFLEIKLFFKFKKQEEYIIDLKREIEEIKLKCGRDLGDINFQFQKLDLEIGKRSNFVNSTSNLAENFYENNISNTQDYCNQGVTSSDEVQMQQDNLVHPEYRQNNENYSGKIEIKEKIGNLDGNKLRQPSYKISLNGSKIYLPPISELQGNSAQLGQCIKRVCQMKQFVRKVEDDRKHYVENILKAYN